MAVEKKCACGYVRTGWDNCAVDPSLITDVILVKLMADDGTLNRIDVNDTLDSAYFTSLVNEEDSKAWFIIDQLQEVAYLQKDPRSLTTKSNIDFYIEKEGNFTFEGVRYGMPLQVIGALNSSFCSGWGVIYKFSDGTLAGRDGADGYIYPRAIQDNTLIFKTLGDKGGDNLNRGQLMFQERRTETMANYGTILTETGATEAIVPVKEVSLTNTVASQTNTTLVVDANLLYGAVNAPIDYDTALVSQWTLTDTTAGTPLAISAVVVDATTCDLIITHAPATAGNDFALSLDANGFYADDLVGTLV